MISYCHDAVICPSVCPSVCLSVTMYVYIVALRVDVGVESCTIVFLASNFLFTSSDTFAVGCIVRPRHSTKNRTAEISASGIATDIVVT